MILPHRSEALRLSGRRLFITGGTGFLGRSLLDYLRESATLHGADFCATVLSRSPMDFLRRFPEYANMRWLSFIEGDLQRLPSLPGGYTDVVHAAADTHSNGDDPLVWLDQLVDGTRRVLDYARAVGVQRLLLISSGAIYGPQGLDQLEFKEDMLQAPRPTDSSAVYSHGKRMAETLCALYTARYELPCIIARCFAVLSRHIPLDGPYAAGNFLRDAIGSDHIAVRGDGLAVRTYIDGRDMAHWMFTLLDRGVAGEAYNVGSDEALTIVDLARRIAARHAPGKPVLVEGQNLGGDPSVYRPSIAKARSLGLRIETPLDYSIDQALIAHLQVSHPVTYNGTSR